MNTVNTANSTVNKSNKKLTIADILARKLPAVLEGKQDGCEIVGMETQNSNGFEFLRIEFKTASGQTFFDNRFPQGLQIMLSHLREQLKIKDEIDTMELLEPGKHKFSVWFTKDIIVNKTTGELQRVNNVNFLAPLANTMQQTSTTPAQEPTPEEKTPDPAPTTVEVPPMNVPF